MTDLPLFIPFQLDRHVLIASIVFSVLSAFLCGLTPALQSARTDLVNGLKTSDVELPGRKRLWGRNALVVAQVATSLMLLTADLVMARAFHRSTFGGVGFPIDHLLITKFDPRLVQYDAVETRQFYKSLSERTREIPGVRGAALAQALPLGYGDFDSISFVPDGVTMPRDRDSFSSLMDAVDEHYFATMNIPMVAGRAFQTVDTANSPRVAIVNAEFAKHYWPRANAVGKRIRLNDRTGPLIEIVGIAQTGRYQDAGERPLDFVYLPLTQDPVPRLALAVRTVGDPIKMVRPITDVVQTLNRNLPMLQTRSYEEFYLNNAVNGPAIATTLISAIGVLAILLASVGLYGVVAYNVSRRTREIGIRIAIGASPAEVLRVLMRNGLLLIVMGTGVGIAMGFGVERLIDAMLFNAGTIDIGAYVLVVPLLLLATISAIYIPARKASSISPTQALRYD
jgi:predicted permease